MKGQLFFSIVFLFNLFQLACGSDKKEADTLKHKTEQIASKNYRRDAAYISYTAQQFLEEEYETFSGYTTNGTVGKVKVFIDSILYSQDSLKFFSFLILQVPDNEYAKNKTDKELGYYFDGECLIGFRDSIRQSWKIYVYDQYRPSNWSTYDEVHHLFRNFYFLSFSNESEYIIDAKGKWVSAPFTYNLNQPEFWTKSIVWQKGLRIPGLYNFQTRGEVGPDDYKPEIPYLKINYPDSILNMFK